MQNMVKNKAPSFKEIKSLISFKSTLCISNDLSNGTVIKRIKVKINVFVFAERLYLSSNKPIKKKDANKNNQINKSFVLRIDKLFIENIDITKYGNIIIPPTHGVGCK